MRNIVKCLDFFVLGTIKEIQLTFTHLEFSIVKIIHLNVAKC